MRKITPLDLLKRDVKLYRADCMMSVGNDKKCRPCTAAFFESILGMIDRIALQEAIARQERKTGKWVRKDSNTFKCSICGNFLNFRGVNAGRGDANYCPNCGAKMEVGE